MRRSGRFRRNIRLCAQKHRQHSFVTPTDAHLTHKNTVLYCCYIFWCHLHHLQRALVQTFKTNRIQIDYKNNCYFIIAIM